ncbi:ATP synthase subunit I [Glaciecola sp. SC05]|uniref:ATP synthase subunit I n=1 Tax=Glaciecola sp. SC05 TaxID=1987355 RepID=UPI003526E0BA
MKADLALPGKQLAIKGLIVQGLIGLCLLILTVVVYPSLWVSTALGVIVFIVPHTIFAYWVFRYAGGTKNNIVAQSFNQGMKLKLIITVLLFVIAFFHFNAHPLPLLGAYVITMVSQWAAMFCFSQKS